MIVEQTKEYVRDALILWSENMLLFYSLHWKRRIVVVANRKNYCKSDEYIHLEYGRVPDNRDFKINQSQWEHSLIIYTKKICKLMCSEEVLRSEFKHKNDVNNKDFLAVDLTKRPNELDYMQSLGRLSELNNKFHLKFPNSLLNN